MKKDLIVMKKDLLIRLIYCVGILGTIIFVFIPFISAGLTSVKVWNLYRHYIHSRYHRTVKGDFCCYILDSNNPASSISSTFI